MRREAEEAEIEAGRIRLEALKAAEEEWVNTHLSMLEISSFTWAGAIRMLW